MVVSLDRSFSPEELQEAEEIAASVKHYIEHSGARIVDNCYAIDGKNTRDKDDAIFIDASKRDTVTVSVYISDIASFLKKGSKLDRKALANIATLYGAKSNSPMLPENLSSDIFSLHEGKLTPALEIKITMSRSNGAILSIDTNRVLVKPKNLTYEEAAEKISRSRMFGKWSETANWLCRQRAESMQLPFYNYDTGILTDEDGIERYISPSIYRAYSIVQETMILANHSLGLLLDHNFMHALFRTQAGSRNISSVYSEVCRNHASLKLEAYTHGTSPIRRYADIIVHRLVGYLGFPFSMSYENLKHAPNIFRTLQPGKKVLPYLANELRTLSKYLSEGAGLIREFRKHVFSEKAAQWVQVVFPHTDPAHLRGFDPGSFSHLLKEAITHGQSSDIFIDEVRARLNGAGGKNGRTSLNFPRDHINLLRMRTPNPAEKQLQIDIINLISTDKEKIETLFGLICQKEEIKPIVNNGSVVFRNSDKGGKLSFAAIIFERDGQEFSCGEYSFSVKENMALARAKLEFLRAYINDGFTRNMPLAIPAKITVEEGFKIENSWSRVKDTCDKKGYTIEQERNKIKSKSSTRSGNDEDVAKSKLHEYIMVIKNNSSSLQEVIFRGRSVNDSKKEVKRNVRRRAIRALIERGDAEENTHAITPDSTFTSRPEMISDGFSIPRDRIIVMSYGTPAQR